MWRMMIRTTRSWCTLSFDQLGVPVGGVDAGEEGQPFAVTPQAPGLEHERSPIRPQRASQQMHPCFCRRAAPLLSIAAQTRAHHVLPRGGTPLRPRDDV